MKQKSCFIPLLLFVAFALCSVCLGQCLKSDWQSTENLPTEIQSPVKWRVIVTETMIIIKGDYED